MDWDEAEDFGHEFGHEQAFPALALGAGYALYRHGQDRQTAEILSALYQMRQEQQQQQHDDVDVDVDVTVHVKEPSSEFEREGVYLVNAIDYAREEILQSWDSYIGQGPLKRQMTVYMKAAKETGTRLPHILFASGNPGVGKGHPLNTNILTPQGWKEVGSLEVGDSVIGSDGMATEVTGVYDRGVLPTYRVTFTDGSSVLVDAEHIWEVQSPKQRTRGNWTTRTTEELASAPLTRDGHSQWFIPMVDPVEHDSAALPVDPYLAGVMLANADFNKGVISLNKEDRDIAERIAHDLVEYPTTTALRFRPVKAGALLDALGQRGVKANEKFIPIAYLTADLGSRRALLAGLLDCDGGVRSDRGSAQFHTTSSQLALGVQALVESLGGTARILHVTRGEIRVDINLTENPFRSIRKRSAWRPSTRKPSRAIAKIDFVRNEAIRCISVAATNQLYVTERYIVTHNTTAARLTAKSMGGEIIELVPPFNVHTLAEAAEELKDGDFLFIDEIHKLSDNGKRGAEILLKLLEDGVIFLPDGSVVECADITVIGATTDADLLPEPVIDRFKIKPYFQPYTLLELGQIACSFAIRHKCYDTIERNPNDPTLYAAIARACRGIPRVTEEMVLACRALYYTINRIPTPVEMLEFLEVEPDGMTRKHIHYITAMLKYFKRVTADGATEYMVGEAAMMQLLRETKQGLGRLERFLIERGLIDRTPRGRRLTDKGIAEARRFLREGKGPKDL